MGIFGRKMNGLDRIGAEVEGGIRELVSRDVAEPRRQIASSANDSESVINNLGLLLQRVSLCSTPSSRRQLISTSQTPTAILTMLPIRHGPLGFARSSSMLTRWAAAILS